MATARRGRIYERISSLSAFPGFFSFACAPSLDPRPGAACERNQRGGRAGPATAIGRPADAGHRTPGADQKIDVYRFCKSRQLEFGSSRHPEHAADEKL